MIVFVRGVSILDILQTVLWMITSTLVLISTIKYKYPLIPPQAQVIIAAFEFVTFSFLFIGGQVGFDYISIAYLYWTVIEIVQMVVVIKIGYIKEKRVISYILRVIFATGIVHASMLTTENIYAFSYFNTFIGEIIWFRYIIQSQYPLKPIVFLTFLAKFVADLVAISVYVGMGDLVNQVICVILPVLDFAFLVVFFARMKAERIKESQ